MKIGSTTPTEVIFRREGATWVGMVDGSEVRFTGAAGDLYEQMLVMHPDLRIGFVAADIGSHVALLCGGPVVWMKTGEERFA